MLRLRFWVDSAAWDVAVTWSWLLWALDLLALTVSSRAELAAAYLCAVGKWTSLPPLALWARLLHQGGPY